MFSEKWFLNEGVQSSQLQQTQLSQCLLQSRRTCRYLTCLIGSRSLIWLLQTPGSAHFLLLMPCQEDIQQFTCFTLNCITFGLTGGRNFLGSTHQRGKYPPNSPPPPVSHRPDVKRNSVSATMVEKTCHYSMSWYFDDSANYSQSLLSHEGETIPSRQASRLSVSRCWNRLPSVIEPGSVLVS